MSEFINRQGKENAIIVCYFLMGTITNIIIMLLLTFITVIMQFQYVWKYKNRIK